jgi:hypothetical protein
MSKATLPEIISLNAAQLEELLLAPAETPARVVVCASGWAIEDAAMAQML